MRTGQLPGVAAAGSGREESQGQSTDPGGGPGDGSGAAFCHLPRNEEGRKDTREQPACHRGARHEWLWGEGARGALRKGMWVQPPAEGSRPGDDPTRSSTHGQTVNGSVDSTRSTHEARQGVERSRVRWPAGQTPPGPSSILRALGGCGMGGPGSHLQHVVERLGKERELKGALVSAAGQGGPAQVGEGEKALISVHRRWE